MVSQWLLLLAAQAASPQQAVAWPVQIHTDLVRLARVEWQMRRSAAPQCRETAATAGLVIDYIGAYDPADRRHVRDATGLGALPRVIAVMPDSPAARAGLAAGDEIASMDGVPVDSIATQASDRALLADEIQDRIAAAPAGKPISFGVSRAGNVRAVSLKPVQACAARFFLRTDDSLEAFSDGRNIAVTTGIVRFTRSDDELALIAGHELAHVVAHKGKRAGLFGNRKMEDEADLLGATLARCAGYDIKRAIGFWARFAKHERPVFLRSPTHRSARAREARLRAAVPAIACDTPGAGPVRSR